MNVGVVALPVVHILCHAVRTSSLSTFDSIELGRYSDDLDKETDDKVAVLEFELRKAYDTIKSLRGSLTEATGEQNGYFAEPVTVFHGA